MEKRSPLRSIKARKPPLRTLVRANFNALESLLVEWLASDRIRGTHLRHSSSASPGVPPELEATAARAQKKLFRAGSLLKSAKAERLVAEKAVVDAESKKKGKGAGPAELQETLDTCRAAETVQEEKVERARLELERENAALGQARAEAEDEAHMVRQSAYGNSPKLKTREHNIKR